MIASLGGAVVLKDGTRIHSGSGGMVGGLSMEGANWAYWSGAGKSYNKFTPSSNGYDSTICPDCGTGTGDGNPTRTNPPVITGGSTTGGGGAGTPTTTNPTQTTQAMNLLIVCGEIAPEIYHLLYRQEFLTLFHNI